MSEVNVVFFILSREFDFLLFDLAMHGIVHDVNTVLRLCYLITDS